MRTITGFLALTLAAAATTPAYAQAPAAPQAPAKQPKVSAKARDALAQLQTAVNANDVANIPARLAAAQAAATTADDRYVIAQLQLKAALAANDDTATGAALDALAASAFLDQATMADLYTRHGAKYFRQKQYAQAAAAFERAATLNPSDTKAQLMVADARLAEGRKADAAAIYQRVLQARQAAGQKPEEALYRRAAQSAYDAKLPSVTELARAWVTAYPSPDSWRNTVAILRSETNPDMEGTLDLLRLMRATGALTKSNELSLYVNALIGQANFIEAQTAVEQAASVPGVDAAGLQGLKATVASKPKVTAGELNAAAKSAQSGMALLRIGDRYYGLGQYATAAETYRAAKARGVDANLANLRTGIALAMGGDKAGATAALNSVSGSRASIAQMWLLYLQSRG